MLPAGLGAGKRPKALICISPPATWWWVEGTLRTRGAAEDWPWEKHILVTKWLSEMILGSKFLSQTIELPEVGERQPR